MSNWSYHKVVGGRCACIAPEGFLGAFEMLAALWVLSAQATVTIQPAETTHEQ